MTRRDVARAGSGQRDEGCDTRGAMRRGRDAHVASYSRSCSRRRSREAESMNSSSSTCGPPAPSTVGQPRPATVTTGRRPARAGPSGPACGQAARRVAPARLLLARRRRQDCPRSVCAHPIICGEPSLPPSLLYPPFKTWGFPCQFI